MREPGLVRRVTSSPALVLFLLAPVVGELVSSSSPFPEFLLAWLPLAALYGCGALLIRETRVRLRLGWPAVFLLGAAYGIVEEGIVVRSFFDPEWVDLGLLAEYGRAAGVNWTWSHLLTLYHAAISIALPIAAVEMSFPERRVTPWLGRRGLAWCGAGVGAWVLLGDAAFMSASGAQLAAAAAVAAVLVAVGLRLVAPEAEVIPTTPRPSRYFWLGTLTGFFTFVIPHLASENPEVHAGWPSLGMTLVPLAGLALWRRWSERGRRWTDRDRAALIGGGLMWLALLVAMTGNPVTIATSIASMLIWYRWSRRFASVTERAGAPA